MQSYGFSHVPCGQEKSGGASERASERGVSLARSLAETGEKRVSLAVSPTGSPTASGWTSSSATARLPREHHKVSTLCDNFDLYRGFVDLRSTLLMLGNTKANFALLSLTRNVELRSTLLTLGNTQASLALLSLTRNFATILTKNLTKGLDPLCYVMTPFGTHSEVRRMPPRRL